MNRPDFFIVGAPKCGTTAMAYYLAEHPHIFMSNPKEPLYFLHPCAQNRKITDERHYVSLFRRASGSAAIGEASVWYLYSDYALAALHRFNPAAKIIVMTRNPVDFVASLHSQMVFGGYERDQDLGSAWRREKDNVLHGGEDTIECIPGWQCMYAELMRHNKYIEKYKRTFGEEKVLVLAQEEMLHNIREAYVRVLSFLCVEDDGRSEFPRVNTNKAHKNETLRRLTVGVGRQQWAIGAARKVKSVLGIGSFGLYAALRDVNIRRVSRAEPSESVRSDIQARARQLEGEGGHG